MTDTTTGNNAGSTSTPPDPALVAQIQSETAQAQATTRANDPEDPATGGINARTAQAKIRHAQATDAAAVGAGFEFTPEQIETLLPQCNDLRTQFEWARYKAQEAAQSVQPPAPDEAGSVLAANQIKQSLTNFVGVAQSQVDFLAWWEHELIRAKQDYLQTEHLTEEQWQRLAKGLDA
jgi:hypothetical protein